MEKYIIKDGKNEVVAETFDKELIGSIIQEEINSNPEADLSFKVECESIKATIRDYESARKYLGLGKGEKNHKHDKAVEALEKLFTIAEAWNREDDFVPHWRDYEQEKWFPRLSYDEGAAKCVCNKSYESWSLASSFGSRLCFKTEERALEFGKTFAELYNDVLLFR